MQSAEYYLKQLLFEYDCVTIPGLGGFIMQMQAARINRGKTRINPPSRHPSFNSLLNHDDGLLISTIARAEGISYRDAGSIVHEFTEDCKRKISLGESFKLEGVGELSSGPDGEVRFSDVNASNFFAGAFGMEAVNLYPLSRAQVRKRLTQKHIDRKAEQLKERKPAAVKLTLLFAVPLILFLLYGIIFPASIQNIYTNYSGIVFDLMQTREQEPVTMPLIMDDPVVHEIEAAPVTNVITAPVPDPEEKTVVVAGPVAKQAKRYYIIGGCFENEENAGEFLADLIGKGFDAEEAGTNKSGHKRISYQSFPDRSSALPYLQKIRNEENASAWLLKY